MEMEMVMPTKYVDCGLEEMDYTGGFSWKVFGKVIGGLVLVAAGVALTYCGLGSIGVPMILGGGFLTYSGIKDAVTEPPAPY